MNYLPKRGENAGKKQPNSNFTSPLYKKQNRTNSRRSKPGKDGYYEVTPKITMNGKVSSPVDRFFWGTGIRTEPQSKEEDLQEKFAIHFCKCNGRDNRQHIDSQAKRNEWCCEDFHFAWGKTLMAQGKEDAAYPFFKFAAKGGHTGATFYQAKILQSSTGKFGGTPAALKLARNLLSKIAMEGCDHICVIFELCMGSLALKMEDKAVESTSRALERLLNAVNQGIDYHCNSLWHAHLGVGRQEVERLIGVAQYVLGSHYMHARFVGRDVTRAQKLLIASAQMGCLDAMCAIGDLYFYEKHGLEKDIPFAKSWYEMAAAEGHVKAEKRLAAIAEMQ